MYLNHDKKFNKLLSIDIDSPLYIIFCCIVGYNQ